MRYQWARRGDVNAFFGLMLDNVAVMIILVSSITSAGNFSVEFVLTRMIPGTALGVVLGDLVYTAMAFWLALRTKRNDVTAMPLGLDTPSTFGVAFLILLPALGHAKELGFKGERGMEFAWHVGLLTLIFVGLFKTVVAPLGNAVRRLVPRAGLLGSLAAIAIALIAFLPMLMDGIAGVPLVGMVALTIILLTLVAHRELPFKFPGALAAVLVGVVLYQIGLQLTRMNLGIGPLVPQPEESKGYAPTNWAALFSIYNQDTKWYTDVLQYTLGRLPIVLPFALATIIGGIDCTESAAAAGDEYDTRAILLTEGIASLVAGLLGGVIQTTPYIGHPAYKKMGGRSAYTLATAVFIGLVGCLGGFTYLFEWLPKAAMFPILVFVGLEIMAQSFQATPQKHYPALALAMLPAFAYLITIPVNAALGYGRDPMTPEALMMVQTLRCLANGFIVSSLLWAAALAMMMDGKLKSAAGYFLVAAVCAFFGIIHSPLGSEQVGLPHQILEQIAPVYRDVIACQTPYHWTGAYVMIALLLFGLGSVKQPVAVEGEQGTH